MSINFDKSKFITIIALADRLYTYRQFVNSPPTRTANYSKCYSNFEIGTLVFSLLGFDNASWQLLEPMMTVEISAPIESQGAVMSIVTKRTGQIKTLEALQDWTNVVAEVSNNSLT